MSKVFVALQAPKSLILLISSRLLVGMLGANVGKLVLRLHVVDGDRAFLDQLLDEVCQRDGFCPSEEGAMAGNMKRRRVVDEERNTVESILGS